MMITVINGIILTIDDDDDDARRHWKKWRCHDDLAVTFNDAAPLRLNFFTRVKIKNRPTKDEP